MAGGPGQVDLLVLEATKLPLDAGVLPPAKALAGWLGEGRTHPTRTVS